MLNAVNLDKLGPTEKAFFLAAEYQGPKSDRQPKGKEESGKPRATETNKNSTDSKDGLSKAEEPIVSEEEHSRVAKAGLGSNSRRLSLRRGGQGGLLHLQEALQQLGRDIDRMRRHLQKLVPPELHQRDQNRGRPHRV